MLTGRNIETMTALTLMSYPFAGRPAYLALAPLTHAAGVLCFPVLALGGEIVIMPAPDLGEFLALIGRHRVTHTFLPPTLIYMLLAHPGAARRTDLSSLQCFWYGAAPMSAARLEEAIGAIGPVMAQLFGQTEAPMMISTMAPADHFHADGTLARERLRLGRAPGAAGDRGDHGPDGTLLPAGERGEIVVRGSLVMAGLLQGPGGHRARRRAHGWHHTGDIGYLDADNYLFIVDRAKDMIITGGFNVYSAEVEQALMAHPAVLDCAVDRPARRQVGRAGDRRRAAAPRPGGRPRTSMPRFVKDRLGSVKAPKQVEIWPDLPRSKVGKVLKTEVKSRLLTAGNTVRGG